VSPPKKLDRALPFRGRAHGAELQLRRAGVGEAPKVRASNTTPGCLDALVAALA
jgi:hypothetical protein